MCLSVVSRDIHVTYRWMSREIPCANYFMNQNVQDFKSVNKIQFRNYLRTR